MCIKPPCGFCIRRKGIRLNFRKPESGIYIFDGKKYISK